VVPKKPVSVRLHSRFFPTAATGLQNTSVGAVAFEVTTGAATHTQVVLTKDWFVSIINGAVSDIVINVNGVMF
jgi:pyridoxal/pyridoxine/pyridoxamine kinase